MCVRECVRGESAHDSVVLVQLEGRVEGEN